MITAIGRLLDSQHNDIQHNDTQHDIQHNDTQHNDIITMNQTRHLSQWKCCYAAAQCCYAECRSANLKRLEIYYRNWGLGKSTNPLSANANILSAPVSAFCSNVNVNLLLQCYIFRSNVTLACYQQAGRVGSGGGNRRNVGVSGKWVH